jgi:hypothetical protein
LIGLSSVSISGYDRYYLNPALNSVFSHEFAPKIASAPEIGAALAQVPHRELLPSSGFNV